MQLEESGGLSGETPSAYAGKVYSQAAEANLLGISARLRETFAKPLTPS